MVIEFIDCEYRKIDKNDELYCENKLYTVDSDSIGCDNCKQIIHLNCDNYNGKKDMCLKFFQNNISSLKECQEKTVFNDKELSKKWSN